MATLPEQWRSGNRLHRRGFRRRFCTTVLPGSRLVGLVGEALSARLDEENPPELLPASSGPTTAPPRKMAAGRYRGSPVADSTMPLRTTLALVIAALWATGLLHAQAPDGD